MSKNTTVLIYHRHKRLELIYHVFQPLGHHHVRTSLLAALLTPLLTVVYILIHWGAMLSYASLIKWYI
jgi:hypothetical protein